MQFKLKYIILSLIDLYIRSLTLTISQAKNINSENIKNKSRKENKKLLNGKKSRLIRNHLFFLKVRINRCIQIPIHCPIKGPNIININEKRINIEKLAVIEFETFSDAFSLLVSLYTKE